MTLRKWGNGQSEFEEWRDTKHSNLVGKMWRHSHDAFFQELSVLPKSAGFCLSVGCGSGGYLLEIIREEKYEGIGLDPSLSSLLTSRDRKKNEPKISKRVELVRGVAEYLPFKAEFVQLCIMASVLDHVFDPNQAFYEVQRVLMPNGSFLLSQIVKQKKKGLYLGHHMNEFTVSDLKKLFNRFRVNKVRRIAFPIPLKLQILDVLLDSKLYQALSNFPGIAGRYFNYSTAIIVTQKQEE